MWGERAEAGLFSDVQVLLVVVVGSAILLSSFAAAIAVHEGARRRAAAAAAADTLLRALLEDPALVHGERGLLDLSTLESLDGDRLGDLLGTDRPARFVVAERTGDLPRTFDVSTAPFGEPLGFRSTAASVWHSDTDVRAARVSLAIGG